MYAEQEALSPLQVASSEGKLSDVQWLVEMGENLNEVDYQGRTALAHATINHQCFVAIFLVTVGSDVNIADFNGILPLHHVASYSLTLVESLVAHGAIISKRGGPLGLTALHIAAKSGQKDIVRFLLKQGADYSIKTTNGDLPIDMTDDDAITKTIHKADLLRKKMNRHQHAERILHYGLDENTQPAFPTQSSTTGHRDQSRPMITFQPTATVWLYDPTTNPLSPPVSSLSLPTKEPNCSLVANTATINWKKRKWYQTFSVDNK